MPAARSSAIELKRGAGVRIRGAIATVRARVKQDSRQNSGSA
jgi:hypothetical protein